MKKKRVRTPGPSAPPEPPADHKPEAPKVEMLPPGSGGTQLPAATLWPKGVSANPGGAPKGKRLTTWLAEFGNMPENEWPSDERLRDLPAFASIAIAQLRRARSVEDGLPAAAWAADRIEGGVDRTVHLTHKQEPTMSPDEAAKIIKASEDARKLGEF